MKNFNSSDSLSAMISMSPFNGDESSKTNNGGYSKEFQAMLDSLEEDDITEESSFNNGKKRKLSIEKVKTLEKYFDVDNKLDPARKAKISEELVLHQRQVSIWFQNRRARWKTKQLERDYGVLKSDYDDLERNYARLEQEHKGLSTEVKELKSKLESKNETVKSSVKEEGIFSEQSNNVVKQSMNFPGENCCESESNMMELERFIEFKDGFSDCNSSEMLMLSNFVEQQIWLSPPSTSPSPGLTLGGSAEECFHGVNESCNMFSSDQIPTTYWYNLD